MRVIVMMWPPTPCRGTKAVMMSQPKRRRTTRRRRMPPRLGRTRRATIGRPEIQMMRMETTSLMLLLKPLLLTTSRILVLRMVRKFSEMLPLLLMLRLILPKS